MLKDKRSYYEDRYMYFTFNGIHSSKYNLFIINDNNLVIENNVGESSEFITAMFQEGSYYAGTRKSQKIFKRKCAAEGLTLSQYKAMMKWLSAGTAGFLVFDSNPYWGWTVVLEQVGDATFAERQRNLIVEFELTWKTAGSYLSRNYYPAYSTLNESSVESETYSCTCNNKYNTTMLCNEYGIPVIYYELDEVSKRPKNNLYCIQGVNNMYQYINFGYTGDCNQAHTILTISHDDLIYVDVKTKQIVHNFIVDYLGESGLVLADGELFELQSELFNTHNQPNGILQLECEAPVELTNIQIDSDTGQIILKKDDIDQLILDGYNYICLTRKLDSDTTYYGSTEWNTQPYSNQYQTYLFFISDEELIAQLKDTDLDEGDYLDITTNFLNSAYDITSESDITSQINDPVYNENSALILVYSNDMLKNKDIPWSLFKCYMGKSNFVTITCENAIQPSDENITVISLNNL